jgi:hypothetical protein
MDTWVENLKQKLNKYIFIIPGYKSTLQCDAEEVFFFFFVARWHVLDVLVCIRIKLISTQLIAIYKFNKSICTAGRKTRHNKTKSKHK